MKFVVIGGDAAGMSAASRAKRQRPKMEVTVFEKTDDVSYSACGMPYNLADPSREMDDLVVRQAQVFRQKQNIDLRTGHLVKEINATNKTICGVTDTGSFFEKTYDKLLIATGASPVIPDLKGCDLPGVWALKSLEDGRKIKKFITDTPVKKAVIIGMGYIALEMAEALKARNIALEMVKPRPTFLPWLAPELAHEVQNEMSKNGVTVHTGRQIHKIEPDPNGLKVVCSNRTLFGDMVLVAVGVQPNSKIARDAGVQLGIDDAVTVDRSLKTSNPDIYSAGDCADAYHVVTGKRVWIPLALRANRAGWAVADNVCGKNIKLDGIAGTAVFKVFDFEVARTGITMKEAETSGFDPIEVSIRSRSRAHAHPGAVPIWVHMVGDKRSGRLLGVQMVGREGVAHRINAPAVALHARMTIETFSQSDLAYAPPFGPTWDPLLTAMNQLKKQR